MAKRAASKQLTQDNWNEDDDEKETPGVYRTVDPDILQRRVIKKARRQVLAPSPSPFSTFCGFGSKTGKSTFDFLMHSSEKSFSVGKTETKQNGSKALKSGISGKITAPPLTLGKLDETSVVAARKKERDVEYYRHLKSLNEGFLKWIEQHVKRNAWCDFTPVCNDYRQHLSVIERKFPQSSTIPMIAGSFIFKVPPSPAQKSLDTVREEMITSEDTGCKVAKSTEMLYGAGFKSSTTYTSTFSFGIKATTTATVPSSNSGPTSSCGSSEGDKSESEPTVKFNFSVAKSSDIAPVTAKNSVDSEVKPFTFAAVPSAELKDSEKQNSETNEDEEYVPPKNNVTVITEEGAVYSKRCKLFCQKDGNYVEKGVGMLYLKPVEEKTQLLIRADTTLGLILLNIKLDASLPMQRMGKNNVLIVSIMKNEQTNQSSSDNQEAVRLLIRVKTSEDADELFEMLNKYKS